MLWRRRPDGDYVNDLPNVRRIMPFLMRGKNQSGVYWETKLDVTDTDEFLKAYREKTGTKITYHHLLIWSVVNSIHDRPRLNRFIIAGRVYQRRGIFISFSGKKQKTDGHPLVTVKREFDASWSFEKMIQVIDGDIQESRSDKESHTDKELKLFLRVPTVVLWFMVNLLKFLDAINLLPGWFIKDDPMYASMFIANLGSLNMDAGYHHLYEYGNIPLFSCVGKRKLEPIVNQETGEVEVRPIVTIRHLYDERVEDGLYMAKTLDLWEDRMQHPQNYLNLDDAPAAAGDAA